MTMIFFGAIFSLFLALSSKSNYSYMFFFMCLTYAAYLNHPLLNLCFTMDGNFSYIFEHFCAYFVYLIGYNAPKQALQFEQNREQYFRNMRFSVLCNLTCIRSIYALFKRTVMHFLFKPMQCV